MRHFQRFKVPHVCFLWILFHVTFGGSPFSITQKREDRGESQLRTNWESNKLRILNIWEAKGVHRTKVVRCQPRLCRNNSSTYISHGRRICHVSPSLTQSAPLQTWFTLWLLTSRWVRWVWVWVRVQDGSIFHKSQMLFKGRIHFGVTFSYVSIPNFPQIYEDPCNRNQILNTFCF